MADLRELDRKLRAKVQPASKGMNDKQAYEMGQRAVRLGLSKAAIMLRAIFIAKQYGQPVAESYIQGAGIQKQEA